jgi:pentalenene oxygenase
MTNSESSCRRGPRIGAKHEQDTVDQYSAKPATSTSTVASIPTAPGALPLLGHAIALLRDPLAFLRSLPDHGDLVQIRLGPLAAVMVCDPELTRRVLLDDRTYDKGGPIFDRTREVVGNALGTCLHSQHRRQRRLTQPAFHPARLPDYAQNMLAQFAIVTSGWRDGQILDVPAEMMNLTMRASAKTMFSRALPVQSLQPAIDDLATVLAGIYRRAVMPPRLNQLPTPGNRSYRHAHTRLRHMIDGIITDRRTDGGDYGDLLSALLATRDSEGLSSAGNGDQRETLTDAELSNQLMFFFATGTQSTATVLAWAFHLLGRHPEIRQRLQAEIDTVLEGGPARFEHLCKLEFTGRVITETLRLYPPGWFVTRTVVTDCHLGGHDLSAGTTIAYSPYLIHHRPDLYNDPEQFNPDRWDSALYPPPPRNSAIPFSVGARKCIGEEFAITEAVLALATITSHWHLQPLHSQARPVAAVVIRPKKLRMRLVARKTTQDDHVEIRRSP